MINLYNLDCLPAMREMPDKAYELAIVDPPYGIGAGEGVGCTRGVGVTQYVKKQWDSNKPERYYFDCLRRVSQNQIICGGNYFADMLPASRGWVYWRKEMGGNYADGELIWTSFDQNLKEYTKRSESLNRIHPTQKPVALYKWLLINYAKPGDRILDTHGGSGSICIACDILGFDLDWYEIDADYFQAAKERLERHQRQQVLDLK